MLEGLKMNAWSKSLKSLREVLVEELMRWECDEEKYPKEDIHIYTSLAEFFHFFWSFDVRIEHPTVSALQNLNTSTPQRFTASTTQILNIKESIRS